VAQNSRFCHRRRPTGVPAGWHASNMVVWPVVT
jgi:hypothetical protein